VGLHRHQGAMYGARELSAPGQRGGALTHLQYLPKPIPVTIAGSASSMIMYCVSLFCFGCPSLGVELPLAGALAGAELLAAWRANSRSSEALLVAPVQRDD